MNNMNEQPNKILFTYTVENGGYKIKDVYILTNGHLIKEAFDEEKHLAMFGEFFKNNGVSNGVEEAIDKGILGRIDEKELNADTMKEFFGEEKEQEEDKVTGVVAPVTTPNPYDINDEYDLDDDEELKPDRKGLKRAAAIAGLGLVVGTLALNHSCSQQQVIDEKDEQDLDDLFKNMTDEQRAFFEPTFKAVEEFNTRTTEDGTFKLEEDKSTLHLTVDEGIALNIILNNYTAEELYDVFGTLEFDTTNLMNLARSAYSKLSTYYMNATKDSGLSVLINDDTAREFFERHEQAVIDFNNNPSTDLSDKVIKGLYYDYVYAGSTGEYAKINNDGVAWFATSAGFGFELANRNVEEFLKINNVSEEEIAKYQEAAAKVGMSLNSITTSELLTAINEEIDIDVMDDIDNKSLCAAVTAQTRDKVEALKLKQQIASTIIVTNAKDKLVEGLQKIGQNNLANEVLTSDKLTPELLEKISGKSVDANQLVEDYNGRISSINDKEAKVLALIEIAEEKYNIKSDIDLPDLINNRFRTLEKEDKLETEIDKEDGIPVVDGEEFNKLPEEEKDDFIKDNGVIIDKDTTTTEEEVSKDELTQEEQQQVVSQEQVLKEIDALSNSLITQGVNDAITYTDQVGAYNYSKTIVNPYNGQTIDTSNLSLFNIVAHASAFGDGANEITSSDAQVQERLNNDASKVTSEINSLSNEAKEYLQDKYGSGWQEQFINETYKDGYTKQVDGSLREARLMGAELKKAAEEQYQKAQEEVDDLNKEESNIQQPTVPETPAEPEKPVEPEQPVEPEKPEDPVIDWNDPNLNPDYDNEGELPYVPKVAEMDEKPAYYLSDEQWEAAYGGTAIEEEAPAKTR